LGSLCDSSTAQQEALPIFSVHSWHYGFYFKDEPLPLRPRNVNADEVKKYPSFWLMQVPIFKDSEVAESLQRFPEYNVVERYSFKKVEALLMVRKNP
jgi:hypothetical protein